LILTHHTTRKQNICARINQILSYFHQVVLLSFPASTSRHPSHPCPNY
jgi:hypothetical protein